MIHQPWHAFDQAWFARHQRVLLWLLACPLIGQWLRWVLCIRSCDVGYRQHIVEIRPSSYVVVNPDGSFTLDARSHPKFAKRIYYAFRPLWWACHWWDTFIAERWAPQLDLGFSVLVTSFPDGDAAVTSSNEVSNTGANVAWSTIRGTSGTSGSATLNGDPVNALLLAGTTTDRYNQVSRIVATFDLSAIPTSAVIRSAIASLYPFSSSPTEGLGATTITLVRTTQASANTAVPADYGRCITAPSLSFGTMTYSGAAAYNPITFNSDGLAYLTTVRGSIAKLGWLLTWDFSNTLGATWVSGAQTSYAYEGAFFTGTTFDPKLEVSFDSPYGNRFTSFNHRKRRAGHSVSSPGSYF